MANAMRGEAILKGDGVEYTITMDADALVMAEEVTGKPISTIVGLFENGAHLGMTSALAWAGLFRQYALPYEGFRDRVLAWGLPTVRDAVAASMRHAWPEADGAPSADPQKRDQAATPAGTGSNS
jgi:hypothetical protein